MGRPSSVHFSSMSNQEKKEYHLLHPRKAERKPIVLTAQEEHNLRQSAEGVLLECNFYRGADEVREIVKELSGK